MNAHISQAGHHTSLSLHLPASKMSSPIIAWRCHNANHSVDVPVQLPAVAHTALMAAGILKGDPLYRFNELAWSWVALENWTFVGRFSLNTSDALLQDDALLTLDGVDTVANLTMNGVPIGIVNDAFVSWELPIAHGTLKSGANVLNVAFTAPRAAGYASAARYPYPVPASIYYHTWSEPGDMWRYDETCAGGPCHPFRNFIRKSPTDSGWDWGPSFMPTGLTGAVRLTSSAITAPSEIRSFSVSQRHLGNGTVVLNLRVRLSTRGSHVGPSAHHTAVRFEVCVADCARVPSYVALAIGAVDGPGPPVSFEVSVPVESARLWWPRGYGEPHLYAVRASVVRCVRNGGVQGTHSRGEDCIPEPLVSPLERRIGKRTAARASCTRLPLCMAVFHAEAVVTAAAA